MNSIELELNKEFAISEEDISYFRENGFIKLKNVLSEELLNYYGAEITKEVEKLNQFHLPMEQRNTYQKAFIQVMNLWQKNILIKQFVFSKRLAKIAANLLGVDGIRLYHDQALYKEPGGGFTPWHADQYYWPLASEKTVTVWIPLQYTPVTMGPLSFSCKSHNHSFGRDVPISDESEVLLKQSLKKANFNLVEEEFNLGEISYHYGWLFHGAGRNNTEEPRRAMTIIYMDKNMRLAKPANKNQESDWEHWCPGAKIGEIINTPLNPVIC